MVLGIETSTAVCSVGLSSVSGLCAERSLIESHIHSEKLLTLIRELFDDTKMDLSQITGIAVSIGPGSFTGLRIGLSTAKGLCYALKQPLISVPSFEAVAQNVFASNRKYRQVIVCVDAKQGEYYFCAYEMAEGVQRETISVRIGTLTEIQSVANKDSIIVTDSMPVCSEALKNIGTVENILPHCRGDRVALLGIEKMKTGGAASLENLEPMYLKDFVVRVRPK